MSTGSQGFAGQTPGCREQWRTWSRGAGGSPHPGQLFQEFCGGERGDCGAVASGPSVSLFPGEQQGRVFVFAGKDAGQRSRGVPWRPPPPAQGDTPLLSLHTPRPAPSGILMEARRGGDAFSRPVEIGACAGTGWGTAAGAPMNDGRQVLKSSRARPSPLNPVSPRAPQGCREGRPQREGALPAAEQGPGVGAVCRWGRAETAALLPGAC